MTGYDTNSFATQTSAGITTVIVLGVDTPIGVAILRDLGRSKLRTVGIGRTRRAIGFASRHCHEHRVRAIGDRALLEQLLQLASKFHNAALMAVSENDNLFINRFRVQLEKSLHVLAPDQAMLETVLDKSHCIQLAQSVGIRVPETFEPRTLEELELHANDISYPCIMKWADPNEVSRDLEKAGLKALKCEFAHSAQDLIAKLKPYSVICKFPLVQEYCPGHGIGQMFLVRDGEIVLQFQHERIHEWPPEGGVSTLCRSLPLGEHQACRARSAELLRSLRWNGVAMVEYRYDKSTDTYYFMEINGRFWGSLPLAIAAGVPFAAGLVTIGTGSNKAIAQPNYPELYCRFLVPELRRLVRLLFYRGAIQDPYYRYSRAKEVLDFVADFFRPKMRYYLFNFSDPGPFLADIRNIIFKTFSRAG